MSRAFIVGLLALASLFVCTTPRNAYARSQDDALQRAQRATVAVETTRINGVQTGSGFVVTAQGVVVTSASVLKGAVSAKVIFESGEEYPVVGIVTFDESRDLVVLRIAGFRLPTVSLSDSDSVCAGVAPVNNRAATDFPVRGCSSSPCGAVTSRPPSKRTRVKKAA